MMNADTIFGTVLKKLQYTIPWPEVLWILTRIVDHAARLKIPLNATAEMETKNNLNNLINKENIKTKR